MFLFFESVHQTPRLKNRAGHPCKSGAAEAFAGFQASADGKFGGADLLAAFEFDGLNMQNHCSPANDKETIFFREQSSRRMRSCRRAASAKRKAGDHFAGHRLGPDMAGLAAKRSISAGPGSEAAHAVVDFMRRPIPVDAAVLFFQH